MNLLYLSHYFVSTTQNGSGLPFNSMVCDTNGDGLPDTTAPLTNVTPLNINLVRGTLAAPGQAIFTGGSFPLSCCGGLANLSLTITFTAGDNNIFGPFALTSTCV